MFCPSCGSEERQASQYCRACGTDLRAVRVSLERPDSITASAISAREEIGRAVAEKVREMGNSRHMNRFAYYVLPKVDRFLESPEEKRMRRLRSGIIAAGAGLGVGTVAFLLMTMFHADDAMVFLGITLLLSAGAFCGGLAMVLSGLLFSKLRRGVPDNSSDARLQNLLDAGHAQPRLRSSADDQPSLRSPTTNELSQVRLQRASPAPGSVTEHTTNLLQGDR